MIHILTKNLEPSPRRFSTPEIELWSAILDSALDDLFIGRGFLAEERESVQDEMCQRFFPGINGGNSEYYVYQILDFDPSAARRGVTMSAV